MSHGGLLSILSEIRCKLLILKATNSEWVEPQKLCDDTFEVYKANCKSFEMVEVEGNHFVPLSNPTAVAPHIDRFLVTNRDS